MRALIRQHGTSLAVGVVAVVLFAWIASGVLTREPPRQETQSSRAPMAVAVIESLAEPVERLLTLHGDVEPDQQVVVRAETAGRVIEWLAAPGESVRSGQTIARLAMDDREARLRRAEAAVRGRESDYRALQDLAREGLQARLQVEAAEAEFEAARADLEAIRLDIENTRLRAPLDGILNRRHAEVGNFVAVGGEVAEILENNPLLAVVRVPQHSVHHVRVGAAARVTFLDGATRDGTIRHVSARADSATRTFRVEITVPNADRSLPAGTSVRVVLPVETVRAHRISPALLALDDQGRLGLKVVEDDDRVAFHPVDPMRADVDGVWVEGLPEQARVITIGQGFVNAGETVRVMNQDGGG